MIRKICLIVVTLVALIIGFRALGGNPKKLIENFESQIQRDLDEAKEQYVRFEKNSAELGRRASCYQVQLEKVDELLLGNKAKTQDLQDKVKILQRHLEAGDPIVAADGHEMTQDEVASALETLNLQLMSSKEMKTFIENERKDLAALAKETMEDAKNAPILLEGLRLALENLQTRADLQRERFRLGLETGDMKSNRQLYKECLNAIKTAKGSFGDKASQMSHEIDWDAMSKNDPATSDQGVKALIAKCKTALEEDASQGSANQNAF